MARWVLHDPNVIVAIRNITANKVAGAWGRRARIAVNRRIQDWKMVARSKARVTGPKIEGKTLLILAYILPRLDIDAVRKVVQDAVEPDLFAGGNDGVICMAVEVLRRPDKGATKGRWARPPCPPCIIAEALPLDGRHGQAALGSVDAWHQWSAADHGWLDERARPVWIQPGGQLGRYKPEGIRWTSEADEVADGQEGPIVPAVSGGTAPTLEEDRALCDLLAAVPEHDVAEAIKDILDGVEPAKARPPRCPWCGRALMRMHGTIWAWECPLCARRWKHGIDLYGPGCATEG